MTPVSPEKKEGTVRWESSAELGDPYLQDMHDLKPEIFMNDKPIVVNLDVMMAKRKMSLTELSGQIDITLANLGVLKSGKAKAIRFSTLEEICRILDCQPGIF